jgi:hypothetical protein
VFRWYRRQLTFVKRYPPCDRTVCHINLFQQFECHRWRAPKLLGMLPDVSTINKRDRGRSHRDGLMQLYGCEVLRNRTFTNSMSDVADRFQSVSMKFNGGTVAMQPKRQDGRA